MQFDTTINAWTPCPKAGGSTREPVLGVHALDDSACNLASLNLMRFVDEPGHFDVAGFRQAWTSPSWRRTSSSTAQLPDPEITANAHAYRELGLATRTWAHC